MHNISKTKLRVAKLYSGT